MVRFHDKDAEADRFFNYPYNALEEALVNAVLHKNYKEDVPVEIRIYLDQIQIINFPGPEHYIDMEKFAAGKVRARNTEILRLENFSKKLICLRRNLRAYQKFYVHWKKMDLRCQNLKQMQIELI